MNDYVLWLLSSHDFHYLLEGTPRKEDKLILFFISQKETLTTPLVS